MNGGKKYKSGKGGHTGVAEMPEIDESQMIGRIIKSLGDRNMLVYCNDGKERICHIRGGLRKKTCRLDIGDIVLLSIRADEMHADIGSMKERGDILTKFERDHHRVLKKMDGMNPKVFLQLEGMDMRQRASNTIEEDDCGFAFDHSSDEDTTSDREEDTEEMKMARRKARIEADKKRAELRHAKEERQTGDNDDDIDIDAI